MFKSCKEYHTRPHPQHFDIARHFILVGITRHRVQLKTILIMDSGSTAGEAPIPKKRPWMLGRYQSRSPRQWQVRKGSTSNY